ncbi:MAG: outer membrane lipoprotein carrier protein LolA [Gemmatimonadetes bacterium]|nr:outer membrane lipoprotein carrier protein LolA [Gemmatimonadota bacterium]
MARVVVAAVLVCTASTPALAQTSTDSLLDRAARSIAAARPISASFEQTLTNPDIRETKTSRGNFAQQGPARFAFRFTSPDGDAIIADGTSLWVYLPSSARGQALKLPIAQGAQLDLLTQLLTAPRASYTITPLPAAEIDGRPTTVVRLTPRLLDTPFTRATLWIDPVEALVRQIEAVEPSGLIRRIRFRDIRTDVELPRGALNFVVPPNVKVIDASGLLGRTPPLERVRK